MAIKKSELYSSLWASCDELRGGMDASQYKDYVLVMLFIKYISDKYAGRPFAPIEVPEGASFKDMVALKGKWDIGDRINKQIIGPIKDANFLSEMPDFNDDNKLGSDKEKVDRLTNLIAIFEDRRLDFSKNRIEGDDILGDAYEYLMRHFATESGKSKGQFYTPSEVSQILSKIIGITPANSTSETTAYDPTCGSGSLLLKVADQAEKSISLFGQEKESATAGLARMNMVLHDQPTAMQNILQGNTLANPYYKDDEGNLKTFDYVVANPPFSDKRWSNGLEPANDHFKRFQSYGIPPQTNGDYAYLLHIVRSLKNTGKGACILPHGVLFRGNAEAVIRESIIKRGYIKGIIGLPANLFFGTGIPAAVVVLDKEQAKNRDGIFMIDASKGYMKEGPKNRLRSMDIHKIVETFNKQAEIAHYSRMVPYDEIEQNEYNLNIPRYIDNQEKEDVQDIHAHLYGGMPEADVNELNAYWEVYPSLKDGLFEKADSEGYVKLKVEKDNIRQQVFEHPEFKEYAEKMANIFETWRKETVEYLKEKEEGLNPKKIIYDISESLLQQYSKRPLISKYVVYQHLMDYWAETMQDDVYIVGSDGWMARTERVIEVNKKGKEVDKGWTCELVPKKFIVNRYFPEEKNELEVMQEKQERFNAEMKELEEEHSGDEGAFAELDKVNKANVEKQLKEYGKVKMLKKEAVFEPNIAADPDVAYGIRLEQHKEILEKWLKLYKTESDLKREIKQLDKALDEKAYNKYPELSKEETKTLVADDKWMAKLHRRISTEMENISQHLAQRISELAERYEIPLAELENDVQELSKRVQEHLKEMGH